MSTSNSTNISNHSKNCLRPWNTIFNSKKTNGKQLCLKTQQTHRKLRKLESDCDYNIKVSTILAVAATRNKVNYISSYFQCYLRVQIYLEEIQSFNIYNPFCNYIFSFQQSRTIFCGRS